MASNAVVNYEGVERLPLKSFTEKAYLDYSMYVILDRALPHVGDGLKPVQRRIIYAMSELGLSAVSKHKKSARTVGDVIGKFHPHGDMACYEAMVLMAQPFSYRYPLVDGQGNWGSPDDPKSFAAMRYTEARLARYSEVLLRELGDGTVDWVANFDGTLEEPSMLPARLPNVLLNGATGIAVGMATDIPPHNAREVAAACLRLLDDPDVTTAQLCEHVLGPDFPTEAEIVTPREELVRMYEAGTGSARMRARYEIDEGEIIITALPYQVSPAKVLEQIAQQMQAKKLPLVEDLRDESDHENPIRLVIVPRSTRVDLDAVMAHLFATTDLERSYRVNFNMITLDGRPRVMPLRELLDEWLRFRTQTVRRRLQYRLEQVQKRLHVLDGLLVAFLNIDEVIAIIRHEEDPKAELMARFSLTDVQAEAILDLKLRHLARLEEMKIRGEQAELAAERDSLEQTLGSAKELRALVRAEIAADAEKYGDERRSPIVARQPAQAFDENALVPREPMTVVLSKMGWVRAAKGHEVDAASLTYRTGDAFLAAAQGRSNEQAIFLDSTGRTYSLPVHGLPSARGHGEPLTGKLSPPSGALFMGVMMGDGESHFILATDGGYGFAAPLADLHARNKAGKAVLSVPAGAAVLPPVPVTHFETDLLAAATNTGRLLVFPVRDLPVLAKGKGNKIFSIPSARVASREEYLVGLVCVPVGKALVVRVGQRQLTLKPGDLSAYRGERGQRGASLPRGYRRVDGLSVA